MRSRVIIILILLAACLYFFFKPSADTVSGQIFGTNYQIITDKKNHLRAEIAAELNMINQQMSIFVENSDLNRINSAKAYQEITIPPELFYVIKSAQEVSEATDGFFDITVGGAVDLWGFGKAPKDNSPNSNEVELILQSVNYKNLILKNSQIVKTKSETSLNLSAIAKGYAVDKIAQILDHNGYKNYMVNIGGEIVAKGKNGNAPWRVGIQNPQKNGETILDIDLTNMAIATSGDYENFFYDKGTKYSHIINPQNGKPISGELLSVSVLSSSAMVADAYATALMSMGKTKAINFAKKNNIKAIFFTKDAEILRL